MLTNKDIIDSLIAVGYTVKEIAQWAKLSNRVMNRMKKNQPVPEESEKSLNEFFRFNMAEVNVSKLSTDDFKKSHLIMTPNGFKRIFGYNDEGVQHCYQINFSGFSTIVSGDKEFKNNKDEWVKVSDIKVGDKFKVYDEEGEVISIEEIDDVDCCSIIVEDDEYYL